MPVYPGAYSAFIGGQCLFSILVSASSSNHAPFEKTEHYGYVLSKRNTSRIRLPQAAIRIADQAVLTHPAACVGRDLHGQAIHRAQRLKPQDRNLIGRRTISQAI